VSPGRPWSADAMLACTYTRVFINVFTVIGSALLILHAVKRGGSGRSHEARRDRLLT